MHRQTERFSTFDSANFFAVHPRDVDAARPWLVPFLAEFADKTCLVTPEDVIRQAKGSECQLWSYFDGERFYGVVATRIHTTTIGKLCSLWITVAHDCTHIMDGFYREIEKWAKDEIGCYAMEIIGREGWERRLPGFKRKAVVLEKSLKELN